MRKRLLFIILSLMALIGTIGCSQSEESKDEDTYLVTELNTEEKIETENLFVDLENAIKEYIKKENNTDFINKEKSYTYLGYIDIDKLDLKNKVEFNNLLDKGYKFLIDKYNGLNIVKSSNKPSVHDRLSEHDIRKYYEKNLINTIDYYTVGGSINMRMLGNFIDKENSEELKKYYKIINNYHNFNVGSVYNNYNYYYDDINKRLITTDYEPFESITFNDTNKKLEIKIKEEYYDDFNSINIYYKESYNSPFNNEVVEKYTLVNNILKKYGNYTYDYIFDVESIKGFYITYATDKNIESDFYSVMDYITTTNTN